MPVACRLPHPISPQPPTCLHMQQCQQQQRCLRISSSSSTLGISDPPGGQWCVFCFVMPRVWTLMQYCRRIHSPSAPLFPAPIPHLSCTYPAPIPHLSCTYPTSIPHLSRTPHNSPALWLTCVLPCLVQCPTCRLLLPPLPVAAGGGLGNPGPTLNAVPCSAAVCDG